MEPPDEPDENDESDDPDEEIVPYTGPRPSPARRWAPMLMVAIVVAVLGSAALLVTHLIERSELQRLKSGHSISRTFIDNHDSFNTLVSRITTAATVVLAVLAFVWTYNRRSSKRLTADGESGVEPPVRSVSSALFMAFWVFVGLAVVSTRIASSYHHTATSISEFIDSRGYLALADLFRVGVWTSFLLIVIKATRQQDEREAATTEELPPVATG
jgi:multisubunit Na+/H+ antiporter MnhB subunit